MVSIFKAALALARSLLKITFVVVVVVVVLSALSENRTLMSRSCQGRVRVMSGSCQDHVRIMSRSCQGHVRVMSGPSHGYG